MQAWQPIVERFRRLPHFKEHFAAWHRMQYTVLHNVRRFPEGEGEQNCGL
jgi:hypothetical protein